jgi:hypothetical protein
VGKGVWPQTAPGNENGQRQKHDIDRDIHRLLPASMKKGAPTIRRTKPTAGVRPVDAEGVNALDAVKTRERNRR